MFAKKAPLMNTSGRTYRKELEYLYARKTAIDALIESLQQYDRFRDGGSTPGSRRKSA